MVLLFHFILFLLLPGAESALGRIRDFSRTKGKNFRERERKRGGGGGKRIREN